MAEVIVVGGGISGLTAAWKLKQYDIDVLVLEEQKQAGGNIKTYEENGYFIESGPHSFMGSSEFVWKLVEELEITHCVERAKTTSKNRYIYRNNKLVPLPASILSFITTTALSPAAKLRLMLEPIITNGAKKEETAWKFFCRRFGKEAATYIMTPFVSGVYAGNINQLGARAAFFKFWHFEKDSGSMIKGAIKYMRKKRKRLKRDGIELKKGLFSIKKGLGKITLELAERLDLSVKTNVKVTEVNQIGKRFAVKGNGSEWKANALIIATPPGNTARLTTGTFSDLGNMFEKIPMAPIALIHWSAEEAGLPFPDGFGFLMPRVNNLRILGTLFPSKLFNERSPSGTALFSSFYGGMLDPSAVDLEDGQLIELLLNEHRIIFNRKLKNVKIIKILRYQQAIPQLLPDHPEIIQSMSDRLKQVPGIFLAGNYLTGVGIEHAVESGYRASEKCLHFLSKQKGQKT